VCPVTKLGIVEAIIFFRYALLGFSCNVLFYMYVALLEKT
jgi:hypothetical protein